MKQDTTISVNKNLLKRLKMIALTTDKKLYEVIDEAATVLEVKYHIIRSENIEVTDE